MSSSTSKSIIPKEINEFRDTYRLIQNNDNEFRFGYNTASINYSKAKVNLKVSINSHQDKPFGIDQTFIDHDHCKLPKID